MNNILSQNNSTLGFTNQKSAMSKARIEKILDKVFRYEGMIMSRKDSMLYYVCNGYVPFKTSDGYGLHEEDKPYYYTINKTEYDFGMFLIDHGFNNMENVKVYIDNENDAKRKEIEKAEKEAAERVRLEEQEKEERAAFKEWLEDTTKNYHYASWMEICEKIYISIYGEFAFPGRAFELLVCIENIDKKYCKAELKNRLHTSNIASRKVFEYCTGLKLPKNNKETMEFIDKLNVSDYAGTKEFKERKSNDQKKSETFYVSRVSKEDREKRVFEPVLAEKLSKYGLDMFIRKNGNQYDISLTKSGTLIGYGKTKKDALSKLQEVVDKFGIDKINELEEQYINKFGLSPYKNL